MKPTGELVGEHKAVLIAVQLLEKIADVLANKHDQSEEHLAQLLDFLRVFVDQCHHGKEEEVLFPELERRGVKREGGPIGVMLMEHEAGRGHVREMSGGLERLRRGESDAVTAIRKHALAYGELLRAHTDKEDHVLFPLADRLVSDDVAASMLERFEEIERDRVGEGKHEAYHVMLHHLRGIYALA
jgi:hemerythrin-like domain-containing protein